MQQMGMNSNSVFDLLKRTKQKREKQTDLLYKFTVNPRMLMMAKPGRVMCSIDYKSQELYVAAVVSNDPVMLQTFLPDTPKTIKGPDGKDYKNPKKDLHLLTAVSCEYSYFQGKPEWQWNDIARDESLCKHIKGSLRDAVGKRINFGSLYLQSAKSMANMHYVNEKTTKKWVQNFRDTYQEFTKWAEMVSRIAECRGWTANADGRVKWALETNSKGSEDGAARMAVNAAIQGLSASMAKRGMVEALKELAGSPAKILNITHDELVLEVPGEWEIDEEASFNDIARTFHPVFKISDEAQKWGNIAAKCLEEAEEFYFSRMLPELNLPGMTESAYAPYWAH